MKFRKLLTPFIFTVLSFAFVQGISAQELVKSPLGFEMQRPKGWISTDDGKMAESLKNIPISDDVLERLLKSRNNSVQILAFQKYKTEDREAPIPTIQVRMRPNPIDDFDTFKAAFLRSIDPSKMPFDNYKIVNNASTIVSGYRAVKVVSTYSVGGYALRAKTYVIPVGKQYYQVTFIDVPPEDSSTVFDDLVKTIKIERGVTSK